MSELFFEVLPSAIGLAITPTAIATVILLLGSRQPIANAVAFSAAFAVVYATIAAAVLGAAATSTKPLLSLRTKALVEVGIGLLLLVLAAGTFLRDRSSPRKGSSFLRAVEAARPSRALGLGLMLAVLNPNVPILIAGLGAIAATDVSGTVRIVAATFLVVAAEVGLVGPILWYRAHPETAAQGLERLKDWIGRHKRALDMAVLLVFGLIFTGKGVAGL